MSNFVIFEDQENVHEKAAGIAADARRERHKLAPLTNKAINNENAFENQVRSTKCLPLFCLCFHSILLFFLSGRQKPKGFGIDGDRRQCRIQDEKRFLGARRGREEARAEGSGGG